VAEVAEVEAEEARRNLNLGQGTPRKRSVLKSIRTQASGDNHCRREFQIG
jgi:hypothetical protein